MYRKGERYRNLAVLDLARELSICTFCGRQPEAGSIVAAHSNQSRHGKGAGLKAHDVFVAYLCMHCHDAVDAARTSDELAIYIWETAHKASIPIFRHLLTDAGRELLGAA